MKKGTKQNIWWTLAGICLFGGFLMVAEHDYINNIATSNAVSAAGYIIGIVGTIGCLVMVNKFSKPPSEQ